MYQMVISALNVGRMLSTYAVSRFGFKSLLKETAGFVVIEEGISFVAEHNDWVKDNQQSILAFTILASGARNAIGKVRSLSFNSILKAGLFSALRVVNPAAAIAKMRSSIKVKTLRNGFHLSFNDGADFVKIFQNGANLAFEHSGSKAGAVLLAGGLTVAGTKASDVGRNWSATAEQFALVLGDILVTEALDGLEELLSQFSPVSLVDQGGRIVSNYIRQNRHLSEELSVRMLEEIKSRELVHAGLFTLYAYVNTEGKEVFKINSNEFFLDGNRLKPCTQENIELHSDLGDDGEGIFAVLHKFYSAHEAFNHFDFLPIEGTKRFITSPVMCGGYATALEWDEENQLATHVVAKGSFFDSAIENLGDVTEASAIETVSSWYDGIVVAVTDSKQPLIQAKVIPSNAVANHMGKPSSWEEK